MRILHTSDWHLGKVFYGLSLLEDQKHFIKQVLSQIEKGKKEGDPYSAILIAGDIYDKAIPTPDATVVFSEFLDEMNSRFPEVTVFALAGNHDSASRLSFAAGFLRRNNIHIKTDTKDFTVPVILEKGDEKVAVYQLPYLNPLSIKKRDNPEEIVRGQQNLYDEACSQILEEHKKNYGDLPSVVCAHLFTIGSIPAGSERTNVGDTERVDVSAFKGFTYGAFGHIHGYHVCDSEKRCFYCGAPLPYHFDDRKDTYLLDVHLKGTAVPEVKMIQIEPLHEVIEFEGKMSDFVGTQVESGKWEKYKEAYVSVILTDEAMPSGAIDLLRSVFKNILHLAPKTRAGSEVSATIEERKKAISSGDPEMIFEKFMEDVNGKGEDEALYKAEKTLFNKIAKDEMKWGDR